MCGGEQAKAQAPELKKFMEKRMAIKLNANRKISGVLRGFDQFMNLVLEDTVEEVSATERNDIGMVVRFVCRSSPQACSFPRVVCRHPRVKFLTPLSVPLAGRPR